MHTSWMVKGVSVLIVLLLLGPRPHGPLGIHILCLLLVLHLMSIDVVSVLLFHYPSTVELISDFDFISFFAVV